MNPAAERYARVHELFDAAADLSPAERAALLDEQCGNDDALRGEVEALLAADGEGDSFGEQPVFEIPADLYPEEEEEPLAGQRFGVYEVIREIGRGGLGAVYLAARADDEYRKEVAIKLIRRGLDTDDILPPFRTERQILAQLDHPNIARLIDGGTTDDGLPYFVMEYVQGEPINAYSDLHKLKLSERLALFRKVCAAVTYAHQHLVVHRDLKPSNILVTAEGEPKLLDFGIAKLLSADDELLTQTAPGLRAMTPDYASPEQIKGGRITTASDVYSLGVLLYEILTGHRPYRLKTRAPEEIARAITDQEPERPSTAIATGDGNSKVETRDSNFPKGDLDNIVLMALRKEPERRYSSVGQFSEDILRHLEGRPVIAHKDTLRYRATKFIRRNAVGAAAAAFVLLTLVGGIVATAWQAKRATNQARIAEKNARAAATERDRAQQERDRAKREGTKAESINTFLQNILGFSDPTWLSSQPRGNAHEMTISEAIEEASRRAEAELANEPEVLAAVHFSIGRIFATQGRVDRSEAHLRASLEIRRRVLGPDHLETAQSMSALGEQLSLSGKLEEADSLLRETVTFFRRVRERADVDLKWFVIALNGLGNAKILSGDSAAGELLLRESLDATDNLSGVDRAIIPIMLSNLSVARGEQGDIDGAIGYLRRSLEEYRRSADDLRLPSATALANLANLLILKKDYGEAESLLHESINVFRNTVGEEFQLAAYPMIHLANLHYLRGDYRQARKQIEHVLRIQQRMLGEEHIDIARSWLVLGKILTRTGETAGAESYLRKTLELRSRALAPGHRSIAEAQYTLGNCLLEQSRHAEAEPLLLAGYTAFKDRFGAGDPRTQEIRLLLRKLYEAWGKPESAAQYE